MGRLRLFASTSRTQGQSFSGSHIGSLNIKAKFRKATHLHDRNLSRPKTRMALRLCTPHQFILNGFVSAAGLSKLGTCEPAGTADPLSDAGPNHGRRHHHHHQCGFRGLGFRNNNIITSSRNINIVLINIMLKMILMSRSWHVHKLLSQSSKFKCSLVSSPSAVSIRSKAIDTAQADKKSRQELQCICRENIGDRCATLPLSFFFSSSWSSLQVSRTFSTGHLLRHSCGCCPEQDKLAEKAAKDRLEGKATRV